MWILPSCPTSLSSAGWYTSRWMIHHCHSCSDGLFLMEHVDSTFLSYLAFECWLIHQRTEGITHYFHNSGAMSCYQYQWKLAFRWLIINRLLLIILIIINVITAVYVIRRGLSDGACAFYLPVLPRYQVLVDTPAVEWSTTVTAVQSGSFWWSMWILPSCLTSLSSAGCYASLWMIHRCHSCSDKLFLMEHVDSTFLSYLAIVCWSIHQPLNDPPLSQLFREALSDGAYGFYLPVLPRYRVLIDTPANGRDNSLLS